ncbi:YfhH family protein [Alkalihalobacillus sp. AL-G]|uniref:YfhH family protein n=1 Tax=Alkalihalobacillus sp. AL-G TaxID=2926399 RepID=UPI00272AC7A2|nr:YfhH family protein [Alkalihalobacillus sp. AL-G]WLD93972.1 YfhH family protein [Alkalihalobacillus sp. AL-G]
MEKRYSDMSKYELHEEIRTLTENARKAEQLGVVNELAVLERKIAMARCYLLDPSHYKPGEVYELEIDPQRDFKIDYMNGIFAWGYRSGQNELEAFPISMLRSKNKKD